MSFSGMTILFTGKLKNMKREDAEAKVVSLGGKVASSVTRNLSILVATSNTSAKWKKAEELNGNGANIQLWTEEQFMVELEKVDAVFIPGENGNAEETQNNTGTKAKNSTTKCSKFETMRPFIIEIETRMNNARVKYEINRDNCKNKNVEYEVSCSDSEKGEYKSFKGNFSHTFKQKGKYKISFRGNLPGLYIRDKKSYHIIDVCQWGDIGWLNMEEMFYECEYFNISADDQPDLSHVTSLKRMFQGAKSMNASLEKWDVSNVTDMSEMFYDAYKFNQPLEKWDVSNVTDMSYMFAGALSFNQPLEKWDVSNVTNMECMFRGAILTPSWLKES